MRSSIQLPETPSHIPILERTESDNSIECISLPESPDPYGRLANQRSPPSFNPNDLDLACSIPLPESLGAQQLTSQINEDLNGLEEKLASLETTMKEDLRKELLQSRENLEYLQTLEFSTKEQSFDTVWSQNEVAKNSTTNKEIESLVDELVSTEKFQKSIENMVAKACEKNKEEDQESMRLKGALIQFNTKIQELERDNDKLKNESKRLQEENEKYQLKSDRIDKLLQDSMNENRKWEELNQRKQELIGKLAGDNEELQAKIHDLEAAVSSANQRVTDLEKVNHDLKNLQGLNERIEQELLQELEEMKRSIDLKEIEAVQEEYCNLQDDYNNLLKTCAKLAEESNSYQNLIENRQSFKDY
jgi:chromosome segregation ATPase